MLFNALQAAVREASAPRRRDRTERSPGRALPKCPMKGCYKPDGHAPKTHGTQATQRVNGAIRATRFRSARRK